MSYLFIMTITLCLTTTVSIQYCSNFTEADSRGQIESAVSVPGDIMIGGLYEAHEYNEDYYIRCGNLSEQYTLLAEAHVFSTRYVNEHILKGKNFTLGAYLLDTCYSDAVGIQNSMAFIRNDDHGFCFPLSDWDKSIPKGNTVSSQHTVYSVAGAFSSGIAKYVNYLLSAYCLPLLASVATDAEFDHENHHQFFLRTAPSDKYQAKALLEILKNLNLTRVRIVYDDTTYSRQFKTTLEELIKHQSKADPSRICAQRPAIMTTDNLEALYKPNSAKVLILLMNVINANHFLARLDYRHRFQTLGVDGWGGLELNSDAKEIVNGSIILEPLSEPLFEFRDYLLNNVTLDSASLYNPWLVHLLTEQNGCQLRLPNGTNCKGVPFCHGNETLKRGIPLGILRRARNVFQTLYVIGDGLKRLQEERCPHEMNEFCSNITQNMRGKDLFDKMRQTDYRVFGAVNDSYHFFNHTNSAPPNFFILRYNGTQWEVIGQYNENTSISWNIPEEEVVYDDIEEIVKLDIAHCQPHCTGSSYMNYQEDEGDCFFECVSCTDQIGPFAIVNLTSSGSLKCEECPTGERPDQSFHKCETVPKPPIVLKYPSKAALVIFSVCGVGFLLTLISGVVLYIRRETPMARGAAIDLLLLLVLSELVLFLTPTLMLPTSSSVFCGISWIVLSLSIAFNHVVFLIKSIRLSRPAFYVRLMAELRSWKRYEGLDDQQTNIKLSQFLIFLLLLLHLIVIFIWTLLQPPVINLDQNIYASPPDYVYWCTSHSDWHTLTVLTICPMAYLILSVFFLKMAMKNPFMYIAHQVRYCIGGWLCLEVNYTVLFILFVETEARELDKESCVFMCIPMITGLVFWLSTIFPITYVIVIKNKRNNEQCVSRKRAQLFVEGNQISIVTPVTYPARQMSRDLWRSLFYVDSDDITMTTIQ